MEVIGWDIGGAHLKLVRLHCGKVLEARQVPYALWQGLDRLTAAVEQVLDGRPRPDRHAVTMTGELADIFPDRPSGVRAILAAVEARLGADIAIYAGDGGLVSAAAAKRTPQRVASANWHATARIVAARIEDGLLVDIGSTTTDIVPLRAGAIAARGVDDATRLATDELVYRGIARTPVMAVVRHVVLGQERVGVMAEHFATMADVYRLTGELPVHADQQPTADGRGKSPAESRARLARMIGRDAAAVDEATCDALAQVIANRQLQQLHAAAHRVLSTVALPARAPLIGAGTGRFLVRKLARRLGRPYHSIEELIEAVDQRTASLAADFAPSLAVALLCWAQASMRERKRVVAARSSRALRPPAVSAERKPR
jgi:(4-(4-[2-(gamma-L-glutamylamino)ethyl]phenoxymethyl)furan-2-yl)methanamine synthase